MYLFVILLILSIIYFIFEWKHDPYCKYKKYKKKIQKNSTKIVKGIKINLYFIFKNFPVHHTGLQQF
jgi:hypothetical protein